MDDNENKVIDKIEKLLALSSFHRITFPPISRNMINHSIIFVFGSPVFGQCWGEKPKERGEGEPVSERRLIDDIISVPVLVIDDIGVERPKDWINALRRGITIRQEIINRLALKFLRNCGKF